MSQGRSQHPNAVLTPAGRRRMVACVLERRDWTSEAARVVGYGQFMHFYNRHRSHGALGWQSPMTTLARCLGDNVSGMHRCEVDVGARASPFW